MRQKNKFDSSKPFKFIDSKQLFDQIPVNQDQKSASNQREDSTKTQIIVPRIDLVEPVITVKPYAKITPNYIRLKSQLVLPKAQTYQLTELDCLFIRSHEEKYKFGEKKVLTEELMIKIIIELQLKAGKSMVIPKQKRWLQNFIEIQCKEVINMDNYDNFTNAIYSYWKNRREELQFPLLRLLWKPNHDEYNHLLAFKSRDKQRRNLRRQYRMGEEEILEQLLSEFNIAIKATERIFQRQKLKFKQIQLQIISFYHQCKEYVDIPLPGFFQEFKMVEHREDQQIMKRHHLELQELRLKRQPNYFVALQVNKPVVSLKKQELDKKQSVINFLASVIYQAQALGLNYNQILAPLGNEGPNKELLQKNKKQVKQKSVIQKPIERFVEDNTHDQTQQSLKLCIQKYEALIINDLPHSQITPRVDISPPAQRSHKYKDYLKYMNNKVGTQNIWNNENNDLRVVNNDMAMASSVKSFKDASFSQK